MINPTDRDSGWNACVLNPEQSREFRFKMQQRSARRGMRIEETQCAAEQVMKFRCRVIRFGDEFEEFDEIGRQGNAFMMRSQSFVRIAEHRLAQDVQFAPATP